MRYLAIDIGAKRTGLAVGDDRTGVVTPVRVLTVPRGPALIDALRKAVREYGPDELVIGLPLNMDGTSGPSAIEAERFATEIGAALELPIHLQDERLTSYAADQTMSQSGKTHGEKKAIRDALAAAALLRDFLAK